MKYVTTLLYFANILDHTYEQFYGKGKKNRISHKNSLSPHDMKLTREGEIHSRAKQMIMIMTMIIMIMIIILLLIIIIIIIIITIIIKERNIS